MKHIKKFNENTKEKISFEDAKKWIKENYDEDKVIGMLDEEISSGNWVDREQMEDEGFDSEFDYYQEYNNGEAESAVVDDILNDIKSKFELDFNEIGDGTDIYDFLKDEYNCLQKF